MTRKARIKMEKSMTTSEILKSKLHKEPLTAADIKTLMNLDKDRFDAWIKRLCELYKEINFEKMKKGRSFSFETDWHSIFLTLLDSISVHPKYNRDEKKHDTTMKGIGEYHKIIKEKIEKYFSEDEKNAIRQSPPYIRSELQEELMQEIDRKLAGISTQIQLMPDDLRFEVLATINAKMDDWDLYLATLNSNYRLKRVREQRGLSEKAKQELLAYQEPLDQMLVRYLCWSMGEQANWVEAEKMIDRMTNDSDIEQEKIEALYRELIANPRRISTSEEMCKAVAEVRDKIINEPSNREIVEKVLQALDGVDSPRVSIIKDAMYASLNLLVIVENKNEEAYIKMRNYMDKLLYENVLEKINK